jgi:hypothetical protein
MTVTEGAHRARALGRPERCHPAVVVVLAGLTVLAIHLVAYPWP